MKKIVPCGFHCIKLINLGVSFGDQEVLRDINLHIHCGSMTAVIGRNGAGKSTLVRALLGEVPYTGAIEFKDKSNGNFGNLKIGYVPQTINIDRTTPISVFDMFQSFTGKAPILIKTKKDHDHVKEALAEFDVADLIDQSVGTLSGGQLQRVLLAMAVHDTPNLLLLDEPVSGIDKNGMDTFYEKMKYLKETHDLAIIVVSHDLDYVYKYADNVVLIDKTVTASGNPKSVFVSEAFKSVFGKGAVAIEDDGIDAKNLNGKALTEKVLTGKALTDKTLVGEYGEKKELAVSSQMNAQNNSAYDPSYKGKHNEEVDND